MQKIEIEQIHALLRPFRRRMLAHDALRWIQKTLWMPALLMVAIQGIGRIWPVPNLLIYTLVPSGIYLLAVLIFLITIPRSSLSVAWRVDQDLHLKERVSSAIAFQAQEVQPFPDARDLLEKQREDALDTLKHANLRQSFRIHLFRQRLLISVGLYSALAALILFPNPMDQILRTREAVAQAAEVQAEELEELIEEVNASQELSEEAKEALLRELEALAAQLRENQGDRAEALEDISRLEQALLERLDPDAEFRQSALDAISDQLTALARQTASPPEDSAGLVESLESLAEAIGDMSEADRQQLSQELQMLAGQAAQAGAGSLAEALSALSQAAQAGAVDQAQQAGEQAGQIISENLGDLADQQSLEAALAQLQNSRQAISQAGQQGAAGQSPGSSQQGQGPGQGQNPSQGQGQGQGNTAGGGGGTNANSLPPATSSGQAGDPQGTGSSGTAGNLEEQIFAPWERLRGENNPLSISGQDTGQGQTRVDEQDQPLPGATTSSIIPYQQVFQSYQDSAYQTVEQSYIPPSLKAYILEYFSQLEP